MERLTISLLAVMHGDPEVISDSTTLEAEAKEELIPQVIAWLEQATQGFRDAQA